MNLCSVPDLRALLERHGLSPAKKWGQHFLVSDRVVAAIISAVGSEIQGILEVGPGPGVLTSQLSHRCALCAVEIDPIAVSALAETAPSAQVVHEDALRADLRSHLVGLPQPRMIVSNMPYNITGPLLTQFTGLRDQVSSMILMMQKEVALRVLAQPGDRAMGSLSVMLQSRFEITKVADAPAGAFFPPPKVDSCVLRFVPRHTGWDDDFDQAHAKLIRQAFTQPRKTLANNLKSLGFAPSDMGWPAGIRPHQLSIGDWEAVVRHVTNRS